MKSRVRLGLAFAVVVAFCVAMTSTAFAADSWYVNGTKLVGSAAFAQTASLTGSELIDHPAEAGNKIKIKCAGPLLIIGGGISAPDTNWAKELIFHGCKEEEPANCTVNDLIETGEVVSLAELSARGVLILFKPKTGNTFTTFSFSGEKCSLAGEKPINGQLGLVSPHGATEAVEQELEGLGSIENNSLEIAGAKAYLKGTAKLKLSSGAKWGFHP
jgi:hypothetical protein